MSSEPLLEGVWSECNVLLGGAGGRPPQYSCRQGWWSSTSPPVGRAGEYIFTYLLKFDFFSPQKIMSWILFPFVNFKCVAGEIFELFFYFLFSPFFFRFLSFLYKIPVLNSTIIYVYLIFLTLPDFLDFTFYITPWFWNK